jgi:hypothetical protein
VTRTVIPNVNSDREYWGAVDDFADRREIIREAISNSIDANSKNISIDIEMMEEQKLMTIKIKDDGDGMTPTLLEHNFFSLGESSKLNEESIGEKGHGTKTYICGERIVVNTVCENLNTVATMTEPLSFRPNIPEIEIEEPVKVQQKGFTEVIIENINIDSRDIDKFRFGSLKAYIKWNTAGGRTTWIWDKDHDTVNITLSVTGYDEPEILAKGNKKVKNNGNEEFTNLFEWKGGSNVDTGNAKNMYMYYEPEIFEIPNSKFELRLAFANLGKNEKDRLLSGSAFKVDERMGAYLSKDGINIEHHGAGWLTNSQEWSEWIVLADTNGWALTQNRGSIRKNSFYDEVVKVVKNQFKLRLKPPTDKSKASNNNQTSLFGNNNNTSNKSKPKLDFGNLPTAGKPKTSKVGEKSEKFGGKKNQNTTQKPVDKAEFMRLKTLGKNFSKIKKDFAKNTKNLSELIESIAPTLIQPDIDGKINFSNSPGGLVKKCESLQKDLKFEVEFAYPIFSKNNNSIPWIGSINRNSKSIKVVFHNHFQELMKELPLIEKGMIIITDKSYKIKSNEFNVKSGGLDYGTCEISKDKRSVTFKPIVTGEDEIKIEMLFI